MGKSDPSPPDEASAFVELNALVKKMLGHVHEVLVDSPEYKRVKASLESRPPAAGMIVFIDELDRVLETTIQICESARQAIAPTIINTSLQKAAGEGQDADDYEMKKRLVKHIGHDLRDTGLAIKHPDTGTLCSIYAVASPDGKGRYVLEEKGTKKRSYSRKSLRDMLPLVLLPETKPYPHG